MTITPHDVTATFTAKEVLVMIQILKFMCDKQLPPPDMADVIASIVVKLVPEVGEHASNRTE